MHISGIVGNIFDVVVYIHGIVENKLHWHQIYEI